MIVVAGEGLVDLVRVDDEPVALPGGSSFNVAIGLARLGREVAFLGALSRDAFGDLLTQRLRDDRVDLALTSTTDAPTTLAIVHVDEQHQAAYRFELAGTSAVMLHSDDLPALPVDAALHVSFGAVTAHTQPGGAALTGLLRRERGRRVRSLDLNVRPAVIENRRAYAAQMAALVAEAELVKTSDEDLRWLFPTSDPVEVAREWVEQGPSLVVVTQGAQGATALRPADAMIAVPAQAVTVADTVGAGDAFTAALLACLDTHNPRSARDLAALSDDALRNALRFASHVAAITCTRTGADPPRLTDLADEPETACIPPATTNRPGFH